MSTPFDSQSNTPIETPHTSQVKTSAFSNYIMSFVEKKCFYFIIIHYVDDSHNRVVMLYSVMLTLTMHNVNS
jgi:hypothetical protein